MASRKSSTNAASNATTMTPLDALKLVDSNAITGRQLRPIERVKTENVALDFLYKGGVPKGRSIEIFGPESMGKTTVALRIARAFQRAGMIPVYLDLEDSLDPDHLNMSGLDLDSIIISTPSNGSDGFELMKQYAMSGAGVVIVDSIPGLIPKAELEKYEKDSDDKGMAGIAGLFTRQWVPLKESSKANGTTFVFLNQMSAKIGYMAVGSTTPGGWRRKHLMSHRLNLFKAEHIKEHPGVIDTSIKVEKSKVGSARRVATIRIDNGRINDEATLLAMAQELGLVTKGSWLKLSPVLAEATGITGNLGNGFERTVGLLSENRELYQTLYDACLSIALNGVLDLDDDDEEDDDEEGVDEGATGAADE